MKDSTSQRILLDGIFGRICRGFIFVAGFEDLDLFFLRGFICVAGFEDLDLFSAEFEDLGV